MFSLLLAFRGLWRAIVAVWRDPETKALPFVAGLLVLTGTIFYWRFEDWGFIKSLYFAVVTLTTVGYGDLHPTSDGTRIFTMQYIKQKSEGGSARDRLRARRHRDQPAD